MSDPMIKLTNIDGRAFFVNAFAIDLIEPHRSDPAIKSRIVLGGESRFSREDPDRVALLVWNARNELAVCDA